MRIGFDLQSVKVNQSGTAVYTSNLYDALQGVDGYNKYIPLTSGFRLPRRNLITKFGNAVLDLVHLHGLSPVQAALVGIDVLHYPANVAPMLTARPTVVTIYDVMFERYPETYDPFFRIFAHLFIPLSAKRATKIITISNFSRHDIARYCRVPKSKIKVIYPGVSNEFTHIEPSQARAFIAQHYPIAPSPYIVFTGEISPRKNLINLILAVSKLREQPLLADVQLVLVGGKHDSKYLHIIRTIISDRKLNGSVHLLGYVPREHLKYILSAARVVAYISLCEGFGFPLVEAMACGTPVVASNTSSIPEVVEDAGLLVNPLKVEEIAAGLERVLLDDLLYAELQMKGLDRSRKFCWESVARHTIAIYEELCQIKHA